MKNFTGHYDKWRSKRIKFIFDTLGKESFKNKTILVLGDGEGDIGNEFELAGAKVLCVEGRAEHIVIGKFRFPNLKWVQADLNTYNIAKSYDYIISMGILYHLSNPEYHLKQIMQYGKTVVLESEVLDIKENRFVLTSEPDSYDQAINRVGCLPTESFIESYFKKPYTKYNTKKLNHDFHRYDWKNLYQGYYEYGQRRFWITQ